MNQETGPQLKTHELFVKQWILPHIESGAKKYEVRIDELDAGKGRHLIQGINVGDLIKFRDGSENTVTKEVAAITRHYSMEDFLEEVDESEVMPEMSHEEILEKWNEITGGREKNLGIVVFELK